MGKTNGATTTKAKAKESPKEKAAAKPDQKTKKVVKVVKVDKKVVKIEKKAEKKVEKKTEKVVKAEKVEKKVEKKVDQKVDQKVVKAEKVDQKADKADKKSDRSEKASVSASRSPTPTKTVAVRPVVPQITYKCPFPPDELLKWRQILMAKRHEVTDDIAGLVKDAMDAEDGHTTPNHIAERGSDADLQDLSLGVAGEEKDVVWQIDRALRKIDANRPIPFGLCEQSKEPIPRTRLQLIPWTPLSIEGATHMESNNLMLEDLLIED